jgi:hypothetical protein
MLSKCLKMKTRKFGTAQFLLQKRFIFHFYTHYFQGKNNPYQKYPSSEGIKKNSDHKSPKREHGT